MAFIIALSGALVGGLLEGEFGFLFGGLTGYGGALVWQLRGEVRQLKLQVDAFRPDATEARAAESSVQPPTEPRAAVSAPQPPTGPPATAAATPSASPPEREIPRPVERQPSAVDNLIDKLGAATTKFFTTGNVVVRVGVVVLFFGVAFLLRYAYEYGWMPVEFRLAGAGIGGIALAGFGWRLRHRSDTYGLILQGAGVGVLYLTIFSSARLYELLPMSAAFALLVVLVVASCVLAVLQKSQALATLSMSGGFLAPVLISTATGNHVALFSYYAMLNAGIFAMAWSQFWRRIRASSEW